MADTFRAWQREILDAAELRDWFVVRLDMREGVVLEEPTKGGLTVRISGVMLSPAFVRSMPLAGVPPRRQLADGSNCWCRFDNVDDNVEAHEPNCLERRDAA